MYSVPDRLDLEQTCNAKDRDDVVHHRDGCLVQRCRLAGLLRSQTLLERHLGDFERQRPKKKYQLEILKGDRRAHFDSVILDVSSGMNFLLS